MDEVVPSASSKISINSIDQLSSNSAAGIVQRLDVFYYMKYRTKNSLQISKSVIDPGNKISIISDVLLDQTTIIQAFTKPLLFSTPNAKDNEKGNKLLFIKHFVNPIDSL